MSEKRTDREIWVQAVDSAIAESRPNMNGHHVVQLSRATNETQPELTDDRPAIRKALRESRESRGVRIRSHLP